MNTLRLGVIGTGSVVREIYQHLYFRSVYSSVIKVAAICDVNAEALNTFGDEWKIPDTARFTNFMDMIERGGFDVVAVNTPDSMHREPTIAALKAGLDVILPKPTSDKIADTHTMIETMKSTMCGGVKNC